MTEKEHDYFFDLIAAYQENPKQCTPWEQKFMDDQCERYEEYGENTRFSEKQWEIVRRIGHKYGVGHAG